MTAISKPQTFGELSPAMRALPNERWRQFVYLYVTGRPTRGAAEAYRAAGFGSTKPIDQARDAFKLRCDERIMAAVAELSKKHFRAAIPEAVQAVREIINDPAHRDRARVSMALIDRVEPIVGRHQLEITGRVTLSADEEALEELKAVRALGVTREKLIELFGGNYLPRLERLEAARAERAKVIDAETIEPSACVF
jgi:hypothetical protein